jgi:hypothetical protein
MVYPIHIKNLIKLNIKLIINYPNIIYLQKILTPKITYENLFHKTINKPSQIKNLEKIKKSNLLINAKLNKNKENSKTGIKLKYNKNLKNKKGHTLRKIMKSIKRNGNRLKVKKPTK